MRGKVIVTVDIDDAEIERCLTTWGYKVADGDAYYGGHNQGNARNVFRGILENEVMDLVRHARRDGKAE